MLTKNSLYIPSTSNAKATVDRSQLGTQHCEPIPEWGSPLTNHSTAWIMSTLHHATSPAREKGHVFLFQQTFQCVTSKLANVRPWDEHRRQQWLTSSPKNSKHNKDARATAQGGHFVCLNSKSTDICSKNLCHWEPPS